VQVEEEVKQIEMDTMEYFVVGEDTKNQLVVKDNQNELVQMLEMLVVKDNQYLIALEVVFVHIHLAVLVVLFVVYLVLIHLNNYLVVVEHYWHMD
jgi:hypothetical protein